MGLNRPIGVRGERNKCKEGGKSSGIEMTIDCWQFENGRGGCGSHAKKR